MPSQAYPELLLPKPLISDYIYVLNDNIIRTQMDSGYVEFRKRFTVIPVTMKLSWVFTNDEYTYFIGWFQTTLQNGSLDFTMKLNVTTNEEKQHDCRFMTPPTIKKDGKHWAVSSTIQALELNLPT